MSGYLDLHFADQVVPVRGVLLVVHFYLHAFWVFRDLNRIECLVPLSTTVQAFLAGSSQLEIRMAWPLLHVKVVGNTVKILHFIDFLLWPVKYLELEDGELKHGILGSGVKKIRNDGHVIVFVVVAFWNEGLKVFLIGLVASVIVIVAPLIVGMNHGFKFRKFIAFGFTLSVVDGVKVFHALVNAQRVVKRSVFWLGCVFSWLGGDGRSSGWSPGTIISDDRFGMSTTFREILSNWSCEWLCTVLKLMILKHYLAVNNDSLFMKFLGHLLSQTYLWLFSSMNRDVFDSGFVVCVNFLCTTLLIFLMVSLLFTFMMIGYLNILSLNFNFVLLVWTGAWF